MTAIVEKSTGRLIKRISAPDDVVEMNTPANCYATDDPPDKGMMHLGGEWVYLPPSPGIGFVFDYVSRMWIDTRTIDDVRAARWSIIKIQRDQLEFGGFEYKGNVYDSDQVSQGRIMGAASAGIDRTWTLADNTTVELSASQLQQLYVTLQFHIASVHERGRIARAAIESAVTKEEVEDIQF